MTNVRQRRDFVGGKRQLECGPGRGLRRSANRVGINVQ